MKAQLIKVLKSPIFYIIIGTIVTLLIALLIVYGPKRLSSKVKTDNIESVELVFEGLTIDSEEDIKKFTKLVKRATYIKAYGKWKWGTTTYVSIHYKDGSIASFGTHRINTKNESIQIYSTNFDIDAMYQIFDSDNNYNHYWYK